MPYSDIRVRASPKRRLSYREAKEFDGSDQHVSQFDGRLIEAAFIRGYTVLCLRFFDQTTIELEDCGQSCCEARWMSTDDELQDLVGRPLTGIEVRDGPETEDGAIVQETQFLIISTDRGSVTLVNHNEHNGYYSGFILEARLLV